MRTRHWNDRWYRRSVGSFASASAQANAQNKAAKQNYEYQIAQRENKWRQTLSAWGHKRLEYKQVIQENEAAAWAGYTQEQTRLNEVYKDVKFKNQDALIQLIDAQVDWLRKVRQVTLLTGCKLQLWLPMDVTKPSMLRA